MTTKRDVFACAAAAVAAAALSVAPASAAPAPTPNTQLSIVSDIVNPTHYRVILNGVYPMQQADAVGFLTHINEGGCGTMHYTVLGDDGNEQYLFDRNFPGAQSDHEGYLRASAAGLEYRREFLVPKGVLNEDPEPGTGGVDEVFVRARFVDADCVSRVQHTPVLKKYY